MVRRRSNRLKNSLLREGAYKEDEDADFDPHFAKRTVLSYLLDMRAASVGDSVRYKGLKREHTKEGVVLRDGIRCLCCGRIFTVSEFQQHAGSRQRKPYKYLFKDSSGTSLQCCLRTAWRELKKESEFMWGYYLSREADVVCSVCKYVVTEGDDVVTIYCGSCPSTYHGSCLGMETQPSAVWHCKNCSCRFCGLISSGSFDESPIPLSYCFQCHQKFHLQCISEERSGSSPPNDVSFTFCGSTCKKIFGELKKLHGVNNAITNGLSWSLIRHSDGLHCISSKSLRILCNSKVAIALNIMREFFSPITTTNGIDMIQNMVCSLGSNIPRLDCSGFFTFILEKNDEIISVASVRIHDVRLAEMPLIGTRTKYRKRNMCRQLLKSIERVLEQLGVEKLVIPAIHNLEGMWKKSFGFDYLKPAEEEAVQLANIVEFPKSLTLIKPITKNHAQ